MQDNLLQEALNSCLSGGQTVSDGEFEIKVNLVGKSFKGSIILFCGLYFLIGLPKLDCIYHLLQKLYGFKICRQTEKGNY